MKRTVHINLGGVPITIDDDAYRRLDGYLVDLEKYFARSGNQEEIMFDIEARMAELLNNFTHGRSIVELVDVEAAIKVMGTPEDFDTAENSQEKGMPWDIRTGKRLFRDPEDKVIGGVCSGLAAYFGIQEVIWVRLAFVLVFVTFGFGAIVYLVIWWLVPPARTAADRLAMEGEPANARNIGRMVERSIENLSSTIKKNWHEWQEHKEQRRHGRHGYGGRRGKRDRPVYVFAFFLVPFVLLARVIMIFAKMLSRVFGRRNMAYQREPFV